MGPFLSRLNLVLGRDLVIQMFVRRPPSHVFLSGAYLENRITYLDDIWYVGGSRSEVVHAEFWAWQMPIKYLICIIYAKISPNRMPHLDDIWYVGRPRVEGAHGDLDGGQRSSQVKCVKLCATATIFGQKKPWCKLRMMMTLIEVKGHQRSNGGKLYAMATIFVQKKPWCKLRMMMTLMEVKGHQRSNGVNYVLWLPYLVKRIADAS